MAPPRPKTEMTPSQTTLMTVSPRRYQGLSPRLSLFGRPVRSPKKRGSGLPRAIGSPKRLSATRPLDRGDRRFSVPDAFRGSKAHRGNRDAIGDPSLRRDGLTDRDRAPLETYGDALISTAFNMDFRLQGVA